MPWFQNRWSMVFTKVRFTGRNRPPWFHIKKKNQGSTPVEGGGWGWGVGCLRAQTHSFPFVKSIDTIVYFIFLCYKYNTSYM